MNGGHFETGEGHLADHPRDHPEPTPQWHCSCLMQLRLQFIKLFLLKKWPSRENTYINNIYTYCPSTKMLFKRKVEI